ncbi:leucine-rich repeat domain-containing protein [Candidatus Woesearchaeota archaeon]|nr:leucine-rich repeat domain-containing protein [Candidatus Woesearchaeota archaeon]
MNLHKKIEKILENSPGDNMEKVDKKAKTYFPIEHRVLGEFLYYEGKENPFDEMYPNSKYDLKNEISDCFDNVEKTSFNEEYINVGEYSFIQQIINNSNISESEFIALSKKENSGVSYTIEKGYITSFEYVDKGLNEIPEEVKNLKNIKSLNLSKNYIKLIPEFVTYCKNLQELDLTDNCIEEVSPVFAQYILDKA